jgi:hypothetical protein
LSNKSSQSPLGNHLTAGTTTAIEAASSLFP